MGRKTVHYAPGDYGPQFTAHPGRFVYVRLSSLTFTVGVGLERLTYHNGSTCQKAAPGALSFWLESDNCGSVLVLVGFHSGYIAWLPPFVAESRGTCGPAASVALLAPPPQRIIVIGVKSHLPRPRSVRWLMEWADRTARADRPKFH